ncbi:NaeI family type II restriction endonuclease [Nocardiopsis dassonvillei]|uniref:NaeI family type II restriction endonuclease n=1 Tax=Nocardiopsis dassonvillei TaxID=2014 RepID=UPI00366D7ECD
MKRVRGNGGSRSSLRSEGTIILGRYRTHCQIATVLSSPEPGPRGFVSARVVRADDAPQDKPRASIDGAWWRPAEEGSPVEYAPLLPEV